MHDLLNTAEAVWHRTGRELSAELSTLEANGLVRRGGGMTTIRLDGGAELRFSAMFRHKDAEGDTTHWTAGVNGDIYTIFNS